MPNGTHHMHSIIKEKRPLRPDMILPTLPNAHELPDEPIAIADMAELFGVTHRTLHFYEEKGLISASRIGLMRIYAPHDVARMALVNMCREIGMPVSAIQDLLEMLTKIRTQKEADEILEEALTERRRELATSLSTIHRQLQHINGLLSSEDAITPRKTHEREGPVFAPEEQQCLQLMAEGYTPIRIARTMELKMQEVEEIEQRIITKVGASNRFQAVAKAVLLGIVAN